MRALEVRAASDVDQLSQAVGRVLVAGCRPLVDDVLDRLLGARHGKLGVPVDGAANTVIGGIDRLLVVLDDLLQARPHQRVGHRPGRLGADHFRGDFADLLAGRRLRLVDRGAHPGAEPRRRADRRCGRLDEWIVGGEAARNRGWLPLGVP
jgi:hypothetical protein